MDAQQTVEPGTRRFKTLGTLNIAAEAIATGTALTKPAINMGVISNANRKDRWSFVLVVEIALILTSLDRDVYEHHVH